jgi:hypothetical protein
MMMIFFVAALFDTTTEPQHDDGSPFDSEHLLFDRQAVISQHSAGSRRHLEELQLITQASFWIWRVAYCPDATANILAHADCRRWNLSVHLDDKNDTYSDCLSALCLVCSLV